MWKLKLLASLILRRYHPDVVAVTGSVGKTSTVQAIAAVLSGTFAVRRNYKNYNNEIGTPLTIIGAHSPGRSPVQWLVVFLRAARLLVWRDAGYPHVLILEMGADHPGDLAYLTSFVPLKIGVITAVGEAHLEFFETVERIAKEKSELVRVLPKHGLAILNADDPRVMEMGKKTKASVLSFGFAVNADIRALEVNVSHEGNYRDVATLQGVSFKVQHGGSIVPVLLPKVLGKQMVSAALAAVAVGLAFNLDLVTIVERLKNFESPPGRMHLIDGVKYTLLIDDTYNSSPAALHSALTQLQLVTLPEHSRKYAVLGAMLELGAQTEALHRQAGQAVARSGVDYLISVGEVARDFVRGAVAAGMPTDRCFEFSDTDSAGRFLQQHIKQGDLLLIKGSQGSRMEKIVKELMAEPQRAEELLVRQDASWGN